MRRHMAALSVVVLVAVLALAAGCVDSTEEAAQTPATAPTVVNSAIQTDSAGKTVTAPDGHGSRPEAHDDRRRRRRAPATPRRGCRSSPRPARAAT